MAQHGIRFVQLFHSARNRLTRSPNSFASSSCFSRIVRNELVQRRIDQPDGDRKSVHRFEDADEIAPLERQQLVERFAARLWVSAIIIS